MNTNEEAKFLTHAIIQEKIAFLALPPDGSKNNQAARKKARHTLAVAAAIFRHLAAKNPGSAPSITLTRNARDYQAMAGDEYLTVDQYGGS